MGNPTPSRSKQTYDVHIYAVVRVKVQDVQAVSMPEAIQKAEKQADLQGLFDKQNIDPKVFGVTEASYAEETAHYCVDAQGDKEFAGSRWYGPDGKTMYDPSTNQLLPYRTLESLQKWEYERLTQYVIFEIYNKNEAGLIPSRVVLLPSADEHRVQARLWFSGDRDSHLVEYQKSFLDKRICLVAASSTDFDNAVASDLSSPKPDRTGSTRSSGGSPGARQR